MGRALRRTEVIAALAREGLLVDGDLVCQLSDDLDICTRRTATSRRYWPEDSIPRLAAALRLRRNNRVPWDAIVAANDGDMTAINSWVDEIFSAAELLVGAA